MNFTILGAGTWGLTLAQVLANNNHEVSIWHYKNNIELIDEHGFCKKLNFSISKNIKFLFNRSDIFESSLIVICLPSQSIRQILSLLKLKNRSFVNASKGIELDSGKLISNVIKECTLATDDTIACLSGPSHAEELSKSIPTVLAVASFNPDLSKNIQNAFSNNFLRVYITDSINAMQVGGAIKNIISIASGICIGLGYGDNTIAALITRGIQEIIRFSTMYTDKSESLMGISGIGDLIVTATSSHSRNRMFGEFIGKGQSLNKALLSIGMTVEGVETTRSVYSISKKNNISMPICNEVYHVLFQNKQPEDAINELMSRELKPE